MPNEGKNRRDADLSPPNPSRREFVTLSAAAAVGLAATTETLDAAASMHVVEKNVDVPTPDGTCDAAFIYPAVGKHPGVLIWTDVFGLRPTFRQLGRRLAASGYAVLIPNPYYRTTKAPILTEDAIMHISFQDPAIRAKMQANTAAIYAPGVIEKDAKAHVAFLDGQSQVDTAKKIGTQGYCMGGPLVFKTAAVAADRVGGAATFHGGNLVTDKPDSPHRLISQFRTTGVYIAIAANDDARQPDAKDKLRAAFMAAHLPAEVVVYAGVQHGWCVADMPHPGAPPIYDGPAAERAFRHLLALYKQTLV